MGIGKVVAIGLGSFAAGAATLALLSQTPTMGPRTLKEGDLASTTLDAGKSKKPARLEIIDDGARIANRLDSGRELIRIKKMGPASYSQGDSHGQGEYIPAGEAYFEADEEGIYHAIMADEHGDYWKYNPKTGCYVPYEIKNN